MTMRLFNRLQELERLLSEATPGDWAEFAESGDFWVAQSLDGEPGSTVFSSNNVDIRDQDAQLIIAMKNALPDLLETLRSQEREIARLKGVESDAVAVAEMLLGFRSKEGTSWPIWFIARREAGGVRGNVHLAGPWFSRDAAQNYLDSKVHDFRNLDAYVYCESGYASYQWRRLQDWAGLLIRRDGSGSSTGPLELAAPTVKGEDDGR